MTVVLTKGLIFLKGQIKGLIFLVGQTKGLVFLLGQTKGLVFLVGQTVLLLDQARNIQTEGASGAFDKEFRVMEDNLAEIRKIIEGAGVSTIDVEELENMLKEIRYT